MTGLELLRALGGVGDDLIARADTPVKKAVNRRTVTLRWAALAACICVAVLAAVPLLRNNARKAATQCAAPESAEDAALYTQNTATADFAPEEPQEAPMMQEPAAEAAAETAKAEERQSAKVKEAVKTEPESAEAERIEFNGRTYVRASEEQVYDFERKNAAPEETVEHLEDGREVRRIGEDAILVWEETWILFVPVEE